MNFENISWLQHALKFCLQIVGYVEYVAIKLIRHSLQEVTIRKKSFENYHALIRFGIYLF